MADDKTLIADQLQRVRLRLSGLIANGSKDADLIRALTALQADLLDQLNQDVASGLGEGDESVMVYDDQDVEPYP